MGYKKTLASQGFGSLNYGAGDGNRTHAISLEGWSEGISLPVTYSFYTEKQRQIVNKKVRSYQTIADLLISSAPFLPHFRGISK
ncbi:hypothetical protein D3C75_594740 [compost metagenome]